MTEQQPLKIFGKIDWRWIGISFCFYVVFHLLPSYVMAWSLPLTGQGAEWMWIVFGTFVISIYLAYRSTGVTIVEPTLGALLYIIALALSMPRLFSSQAMSAHRFRGILFWGIAGVLVFTFFGAWLGEVLQRRKERREQKV
jgi:hypothetical protein